MHVSSHGITAGGLPVGSAAFERHAGLALAAEIDVACKLITRAAAHDTTASRSDLFNMLKLCVDTKLTYFARGVCPAHSRDGLVLADQHILGSFFQLVGVAAGEPIAEHVRLNVSLPTKLSGRGLSSTADVSFSTFLASILLTGPSLAQADPTLDASMRSIEGGNYVALRGYPGLNDALKSAAEALAGQPNPRDSVADFTAALLNFPSKAQKGVSTVLGGAFRLAQQLVVERALRADAAASGNFRPLTWWQGLASSEARSLWQNTSPSPRHKLSNPAWQTYARLAVGLPLLNLPGGQAVCPACGQTVFPDLLHALSCIRNRAQLTSRHTMVQTALLRALNSTRACANRAEVSVDCLLPRTAGTAPCIADIVSTPHNAADGAAMARRRKLPDSQHPYRGTLIIELTITNPGLKHLRAQVRGAAREGEKRTKYLRAYAAIDTENLLVICFETSGNLTTTAFSGIVRLANAAIDRNAVLSERRS
jgi:hypothetical protein